MATVRRFEDLEVWKEARQLTSAVYRETQDGAFSRDFGLRDQIQRAAVSIMNNIAEGFESRTQSAFINFLGHARASAGEVRSLLYIALDLEYISPETFGTLRDQAKKISSQIYRLIKYLQSRPNTSCVQEPPSEYTPSPETEER